MSYLNRRLTDQEIDTITKSLKAVADRKDYDAGMSGSFSNEGSTIKKQIEIYIAGMQHKFPKDWEIYLKEIDSGEKAEYEEFLRLKKKFG